MTVEYNSIMKNDLQDIVLKLIKKIKIDSRWLFKIKNATNGRMRKYKAKFVGRRFSHKEVVDYDDTFAPVACYTSI